MKKRNRIKKGGKLTFLAAAVLMALLVSACGGSTFKQSAADMAENTVTEMAERPMAEGGGSYELSDNAYDMEQAPTEGETADEGGTPQVQAAETGRKLIRTADLEAETYSFQELLRFVEEKTAALGGYIEAMDTYNGSVQRDDLRYATLTIRIPKDQLDGFVKNIGEEANVINRSESVEDVTLTYVDMQSHKKALETEQKRLLELLEKVESLEDILTIESRLSEVRYQLESMESKLRTMDNLVDYSTVNLHITEVEQYSASVELSGWERMSSGFLKSVENVKRGLKEFVIGAAVFLPYLLAIAIGAGLIVGGVLLCIYFSNKGKKKKQNRSGENEEKQNGAKNV